MDFRELLMCAEENQKSKESKPQKSKFLKTQLPPPKRDLKNEVRSEPKSEVLKKLLEEKEEEKRRKQMEQERERRKREEEKRRQDEELRHLEKKRLREEKKKNTFRIPKKVVPEDDRKETSLSPSHHREVLSDGSFSLDSDLVSDADLSDFEGQLKDKRQRSSSYGHNHKSSDGTHRHSKNHSSSHKSSDKASTSKSSNKHISSVSSNRYSSSDENQKMSHSERHSDQVRASDKTSPHNTQFQENTHRESRSERSSSENHKNSRSNSEKHQHTSTGHSYKSSHSCVGKQDGSGRREHGRNSLNKSASSSSKENPSKSSAGVCREDIEPESTAQDCGFSTLSRHHLKPNIVRQGGSLEEREKVLARLQAILAKQNASEESMKGMRKRTSKEEAKTRKSRRNKADLEGVVLNFSGSCLEPVPYSPDEKPSLRRPEPKPEPEPKPVRQSKPTKQAKAPLEKMQKIRSAPSTHSNLASNSRHSSKRDSSSPLRDRVKPKPKPRPPPPPLNFSELLKIAEEKHTKPVMVEVTSKKKESRPKTQDEIDRARARQERVRTEDYKDWFKHGEQGVKGKKPENVNGHVEKALPTNNQHSQHKSGQPVSRASEGSGSSASSSNMSSKLNGSYKSSSSAGKQPVPGDAHLPSKHFSQEPQKTARPVVRPGQPDPNRPGVIAGKPRAMMQHISRQSSSKGKLTLGPQKNMGKRPASAERDSPVESVATSRFQSFGDKGKGANVWDSLFSRPEYKRKPPAPKRRMVIDSEDEDEYDNEMADFIDDGGDEDMDTVSGAIRQLFGYDKQKYRYVDEDDDDDNMEASFSQVMKEEARSAKLGLMEDLEDMRREEEEQRRKIARKKMLAHR